MENLLGSYLASFRDNSHPHTPTPPPPLKKKLPSPGVKWALCIAETRPSYWLPLVIRNAQYHFPGVPLIVIAPQPIAHWLSRQHITVDFHIVWKNVPARASAETFSKLMLSSSLWEELSSLHVDYVLTFQTDCVFVRGSGEGFPDEKACSVDFLGAPCGNIGSSGEAFVIYGGRAWRNVKAHARAVSLMKPTDVLFLERYRPEDVVFTETFRSNNFKLPTFHHCLTFALESYGDPSSVIGIHGTDKYYAPSALLAAALPYIWRAGTFVVDAWCFNGEPIVGTRLKVMDSLVDLFVIAEARSTHAGDPKPFLYKDAPEFASLFEKYAHKIRWLIIDDPPVPPPPAISSLLQRMPWVKTDSVESWYREMMQREQLLAGIADIW